MKNVANEHERLLLIDTCGETAGVAIGGGTQVLAAEDLARGSASAEILQAVRRLLAQLGWNLPEIHAIGVVSGPGSFTGIRAGLSTAKGLCESLHLPLAAVSRLEVLAEAAGLQAGVAALDAGRGELYLRDIASGREWLSPIEYLTEGQLQSGVAVAEPRIAERLNSSATILRPLHASDALQVVLRRLRVGGSDVASTDANYVREESDIYQKPKAPPTNAEASPGQERPH